MTPHTGYFAVFLYCSACFFIALRIKKISKNSYSDNKMIGIATATTWVFAIVFHLITLYSPLFFHEKLYLDFFSAASHISLITSFILFVTTCKYKIDILGLFVLPITALFLIISIRYTPNKATPLDPTLAIHILLSLLAYGTLFLATVQAMLLYLQNKQLHNHQTNQLIRSLPALQNMEKFLFHMILTGVILLTAGLISGLIFLDDLFSKHVLHKTVLSMTAWVVYTILLIGHWKQGWRGRTATHWTFSAFALLILAFFGSKFVYEFLLQK
jgi:ABC-type uncharacterized transport system permease subunit